MCCFLSVSGGKQVATPTQQFTEDFDFIAMNEKFNKDEVWGTLGGKGEGARDEEDYDYDDGHVEDDVADPAESDGSKKVMHSFFSMT
jgi:protein LSM14